METLGSQEGILKAKLELLDGLKPGAPLLLNGDDPFLKDIAYTNRPVLFFGMENQACDFRAENIEQGEDSTRFVLCHKGKRYPVTLPTIGLHNVYDALAAFGAGVTLGAVSYTHLDVYKRQLPGECKAPYYRAAYRYRPGPGRHFSGGRPSFALSASDAGPLELFENGPGA